MSSGVTTAWLGLGGNIGDVRSAMANALMHLDANENIEVFSVSPIYKTAPWGLEDQPWFLNCCAGVRTDLAPEHLLELCQNEERAGKRERTLRWGPRTLDIDILVFEGTEQLEQRLTLPHPRMLERAFVLVPLADIAPTLLLSGKTASERALQMEASDLEVADNTYDWWKR